MALDLVDKGPVDREENFLIGDKESNAEAAKRVAIVFRTAGDSTLGIAR